MQGGSIMKEKIQKEISYLKSVIESDKAHLDASVTEFKESIHKYDAYQIATFAAGLADGILIARKIQRDDLLVLHLAPPPFTLFTANAARRSRGTRKKFFLPLFYPMAG